MKKLHLTTDYAGHPALEVPLDFVTEKLAWIGVSGSGKSYGASKAAEELWAAHAQFVILDPVGIHYGLRLAKDGKAAGIPIPVFGGLHGDVPLEATGGALVADLIVDRDLSAVVDVSQFDTDADKARFVAAFADRLYQRRKRAPAAIHVFLEEAQEFVPQNPQPGEQMMLHRLHRLQKIGRNFGIGTSIITQRPQETSKKALNQAQTVFMFRLTGSQERKAMEAWINDKGLDRAMVNSLAELQTGTGYCWSPAWLRTFRHIKIAPKRTFDASATPKVGERQAARELTPIDIAKLRDDMKATIEKAKAEDPKLLRAQVAEWKDRAEKLLGQAERLEAQASAKPAPAPNVQRIEIPMLRAGELDRLEKLLERSIKHADKVLVAQRGSTDVISQLNLLVDKAKRPIEFVKAAGRPAQPVKVDGRVLHDHKPEAVGPRFDVGHRVRRLGGYDPEAPGGKLGPAHRRVLNSLAWVHERGVTLAPRAQVAVLAGMTPNSGYYERLVGELKTRGLVAYPQGGMLTLTPEGQSQADPGEALGTSAAIQADVLRRLNPSQQRVLQAVIDVFPGERHRDVIATASGMTPSSGYYERVVGELKTMGVVTYPGKGQLRAADILFVEGT